MRQSDAKGSGVSIRAVTHRYETLLVVGDDGQELFVQQPEQYGGGYRRYIRSSSEEGWTFMDKTVILPLAAV